MDKVDSKIELASNMCKEGYETAKFNYIYPFTTENISGYFPLFTFIDKSLLTVGSSGDQALNAILYGCHLIQVCDICPFTEEYFQLKKSALLVLDRKKFIKFFSKRGNFNLRTYRAIREVLSEKSDSATYFWDELFKKYDASQIRRMLFSHEEKCPRIIKAANPYLGNDEYYNMLKKDLDKATVVFTNEDIFDITPVITFDNIFLSNLATYYSRDKIRELFERMLHKLSSDGKILIAYLYDTDFENEVFSSNNDMHNLWGTLKIFPKGTVVNSFIGISGLEARTARFRDSALCYKKVKKIS